jgi:hypothetical protein
MPIDLKKKLKLKKNELMKKSKKNVNSKRGRSPYENIYCKNKIEK